MEDGALASPKAEGKRAASSGERNMVSGKVR